MNKYFGLTIGLTVIGTAAFAGGSTGSLEGAVNNMAQGQPTAQGSNDPNSALNGYGNKAGSGYRTMMVPVPEPAGMAALTVAIGSLLMRKRKATRP